MLPDKNELNDEIIEQISSGNDDRIKTWQKTEAPQSKDGELPYTCRNCGMTYSAAKRRTDGYCPNCEKQIIPKIAPVGDLKTTVPGILDKEKLFKLN